MSYGINNKMDFHGYLSNHIGNYNTYYAGVLYQFFNNNKLKLSSAIGFRKRLDSDWTHLFLPQLLYTVNINKQIYFGGSIVNVLEHNFNKNYGTALDFGLFYELSFETKKIQSITLGLSAFHPATWKPKSDFLPAYSIDIHFKK